MLIQRSFLVIISLLLSFASCAGQNDDCMTAKWHEGEEHSFRMEGTTYEVSEVGDTTFSARGSYDFRVSVVKATKKGYQMRLDYPTSIYTSNMEIDLSDIGEFIPIEFETDEFGIFEDVTNTDFLIKLSDRMIDAAIKLPQLSSMNERDLRAMLNSYMSPERMVQSFSQDINLLLWAYGVGVQEGVVLKNESSVEMGGKEIPTTISILYSPEEKENGLFVVNMVTDYDSDAMAPFISQFIGQLMSNVQDKGKYDQKEFEDFMSKAQMQITDYYLAAINVDTTWPMVTRYIREVTIESEGKTQQKIQQRVIYDLEEEE